MQLADGIAIAELADKPLDEAQLASAQLENAADVLARNPVAIQLRYFQTLTEVASDKSSTIVFPLPVDLLSHVVGSVTGTGSSDQPAAPSGSIDVESES